MESLLNRFLLLLLLASLDAYVRGLLLLRLNGQLYSMLKTCSFRHIHTLFSMDGGGWGGGGEEKETDGSRALVAACRLWRLQYPKHTRTIRRLVSSAVAKLTVPTAPIAVWQVTSLCRIR